MFEFLFNYPADIWQGARFTFAHAWPWWLIALALGLGVVSILVSLMRLPLSMGRRAVIGVLQTGLLAIVMSMLFQPTLMHDEVRRDDNVVAVVMDASVSMDFPNDGALDSAGRSRLNAAIAGLESIQEDLQETFDTRSFSISDRLLEWPRDVALSSSGSRTDLAGGLSELLDQASAGELAAVVLLSDGGNNASMMDVDWWNRIRQANVPIHTVGVGPEQVGGDVELSDVSMPTEAAPNSSVTARVLIQHPSDRSTVRLRVKHGEELRFADNVDLLEGGTQTTHELTFPAGDSGVQALEFSVQSVNAETNSINNRAERVLNVVNAPKRILYVEGEPRWEFKFLRRAVATDPSIEVVSLLRTSPNKFYRQGVVNGRELENGFPQTREALFGYDAIIIGSLDAAELSIEQQANVRDFVAERGGALLMLGGSAGLADGGWGRSVVQAALPVQLEGSADTALTGTFLRERVAVELTEFGRRADWLKLPAPFDAPKFDGEGTADSLNSSEAAWASLPALADLQRVGEPRAGAQVMLRSRVDEDPVLTWHRYGKGRSYVLATSGTWRWQMSLPSEDQRHQVFWQNLLGELAGRVPSRVRIDAGAPIQRDQQTASISVEALNADFSAHNADQLDAELTRADGSTETMTLLPDINRAGMFVGAFDYTDAGPHSVSVAIKDDDDALEVNIHKDAGSAEVWWMYERGTAEYFSPGLQTTVLRRIADETGGLYRSLSSIAELPESLLRRNNALTRLSELPVWNMPALFLALLLGKLLEWALRLRWKRL